MQDYQFWIIALYLGTVIRCESPALRIISSETKPIRHYDIGLYFDIRIENVPQRDSPNETLFVVIRPEECCMKFSGKQHLDCDLSLPLGAHLVGIPPGHEMDVTLVYPMMTVFNRVGHCDVDILSNRTNGESINLSHRIEFNTTEKLEHYSKGKCQTEDLDWFDDCVPVCCEDKYFGQRNYFNGARNICEVAVRCTLPKTYDSISNECVDHDVYMSELDEQRFQDGEFDHNVWPSPAVLEQRFSSYEQIVVPRYIRTSQMFTFKTIGLTIAVLVIFYVLTAICVCSIMRIIRAVCTKRRGIRPPSQKQKNKQKTAGEKQLKPGKFEI